MILLLEFKIDVLEELKKRGYNTTKIREENLIGQKTLYDIKKGIVPGIKVIDTLCRLLNRQPGSLIKWIPDKDLQPIQENSIDYFLDDYPIE